jgi:predicted S18 family serine protease
MTGSINPDFSIGPVGGIPQKLEGAAARGKTVVLIPSGQRYDTDAATGEFVDVVQKGQSLGIEVEEVGDIFEAYELLTGRSLPQPVTQAGEPEVGTAAYDVVFSQTGFWLALTEERLAEYDGLPAEFKTDYEEGSAEDARALTADANRYLSQGMLGPGYFAALDSYRYASQAYNYTVTEEGIQNQGEAAVVSALAEGQIHEALAETQDQLLSTVPANVAQALALMEAWGRWTAASGLVDEADSALMAAQPSEGDEDSLGEIYLAVFNHTKAYRALWAAADALELGATLEGAPIAGTESLEQLAEAYRLASDANLETIRALVVAPAAEAAGVSEAEAQSTLAMEDDSYAEARAVQAYYTYLGQMMPEGPERAYAVLGAALTGFADSSVSLADHYSYMAERGEDGAIMGYGREKALLGSLDFARERARIMIAEAAESGSDAVLPVLYYQDATLEREGEPSAKLEALYDYWTAGLYARVAAVLGGSLQPLAPRTPAP